MKLGAVLGGFLIIKPRINLKILAGTGFNYHQGPKINHLKRVYVILGVGIGGNSRFLHGSSSHLIEKKLTEMTDKDWEKKLTPDQYYVCRERGTEPPFSGKFYNHFEKGMYSCVCCGVDLFSSESKFQSGCGWPSFHTAHGAINGDESKSNIIRRPDNTRGMLRTEVICKNVRDGVLVTENPTDDTTITVDG